MNKPTPSESLDVLANVLIQISLPGIAPEGRISHQVITDHLTNIQQALEPQPESGQQQLAGLHSWVESEMECLTSMPGISDNERGDLRDKYRAAQAVVNEYRARQNIQSETEQPCKD